MFRRIPTIIATVAFVFCAVPVVRAQMNEPAGAARAERNADRPEPAAGASIVGSWLLDVQSTETPAFEALQTFHFSGTMTETSSLFATLGEGPGHGVWRKDGKRFSVTFELFIFEPDATPAGRIRVRESFELTGEDQLSGYAIADLILPDGTIIENIDAARTTGRRIKVVPVQPHEIGAQTVSAYGFGFGRRW